jgi:hypothetical protein
MLETSLASLLAERQEAQETLTRIDGLFAKFGITVGSQTTATAGKPGKRKGGWPKGKPRGKAGGRRKRQTFEITAHEFVLGLLKSKSLTTAEVNAAWKQAGRGGNAGTTLTQLFQGKKIKREAVKSGKGSKYSVA